MKGRVLKIEIILFKILNINLLVIIFLGLVKIRNKFFNNFIKFLIRND